MSTTLSQLDHDAAGLEVVQRPDHAELEVSTKPHFAHGLQVFRGDEGLEVASNGSAGVGNTETGDSNKEREPRRKMPWLIAAAIVFLLVVVGAVLSGVLVSRHNHETRTTPNATMTPSSTSSSPIYAGSSIGVTGWWTSTSDFSIRLVYQGGDGDLRLMRYNSGQGNWSTMTTLTDLDAKLGSPIATSCFNSTLFFDSLVTGDNNYTQIEIFYVNNAGLLQEWWFREQEIPSAQTWNGNGSLSPNGWKAGVSSRLATYWPSLILQDDSDQVQEIYYYNGSWTQNALGLACQNHSAFAVVPYSVSAGREGGESFIYQRDDQKLLVEERKQYNAKLSADAPDIAIPPKAAIGAFSVPRTSNQTDTAMNNYIIWQNVTGALQMTWVDDDTGWRTSSMPASLGSPDSGTDIACLTPTIWSATPLQPEYGIARCYYLVDRQIREVQYDGSSWSVVGNVQLG
ncbi:hypothetical protein V8C37DRAFT_368331 [Trichoderma ceciliae]